MPSAIIASGNYSYWNSDIPEGQFPMKHGRFNSLVPLSFVADTIILPYTAYRQASRGDVCASGK